MSLESRNQWRLRAIDLGDKPICTDRRCDVARDPRVTGNVVKSDGKVKGAWHVDVGDPHLSTSIPFLLFATISNRNNFSGGLLSLEMSYETHWKGNTFGVRTSNRQDHPLLKP